MPARMAGIRRARTGFGLVGPAQPVGAGGIAGASVALEDQPRQVRTDAFDVDGKRISTIDVVALDTQVAEQFELLYAYDAGFWDDLTEATAELRRPSDRGRQVHGMSQ